MITRITDIEYDENKGYYSFEVFEHKGNNDFDSFKVIDKSFEATKEKRFVYAMKMKKQGEE